MTSGRPWPSAVRVARHRFAIGWLNRSSLLYRQKGREGGSGAYRGARWHSAGEVRALFSGLPVRKLKLRSAIFLPSATRTARCLEQSHAQRAAVGRAAAGDRREGLIRPGALRWRQPGRRRVRRVASAGGIGVARILSMRLPSRSTTSSRQFSQVSTSPVCGNCPDSHITSPLSVW